MGQAIEVDAVAFGDVVIYSTDRSITGQDGVSYFSAEAADQDDRFPGRLASRLFAAESGLLSIFLASNQVVVKRDGGFDQDAADSLSAVIGDFFLFYPPE